jgi:hypothetical protein
MANKYSCMGLENCKFLFGGDPIILTTRDKSTQKFQAFVVDRRKCRFLALQRPNSDDQPLAPACGMKSPILVSSGLHTVMCNIKNGTWSNNHISALHIKTTLLVEEKLQANTKQAKELEDAFKTEFERLSVDIDNEEFKKELWDQLLSQAIEEKLQKEEQHKADIREDARQLVTDMREDARQLINKPTEDSGYASSLFTDTTVFTDSTASPNHTTDTHSPSHNSGGSRNSSSQQHSHSDSHGQNTADLIHELLRKQRDDLTMKFEKEARDVQRITQRSETEAIKRYQKQLSEASEDRGRCQELLVRIEGLEKKLSEASEYRGRCQELLVRIEGLEKKLSEAKASRFQEALKAIKNSSFSTISMASVDARYFMSTKWSLLVATLDKMNQDFQIFRILLYCILVYLLFILIFF